MSAPICADLSVMDSPNFVALCCCCFFITVTRAQGKISLNVFTAGFPTDQRNGDKEFVIRRAATNRVLNVLRHWVSKHSPVKHPNTIQAAFIGTLHNIVILTLIICWFSLLHWLFESVFLEVKHEFYTYFWKKCLEFFVCDTFGSLGKVKARGIYFKIT